jgi:hypothetical protein
MELGFGITAVSLVTLRPLFRNFKRYLRTRYSSSGSGSGSSQKRSREGAECHEEREVDPTMGDSANRNFLLSATQSGKKSSGRSSRVSSETVHYGNNFLLSATDPRSGTDKLDPDETLLSTANTNDNLKGRDFLLSASDGENPGALDDVEKGKSNSSGSGAQRIRNPEGTRENSDPLTDLIPVYAPAGSRHNAPYSVFASPSARAKWWNQSYSHAEKRGRD